MEGYTKLADLMGRNSELAICRRFGTLNMKNLLYLQAELIQLESELQLLVEVDQAESDKAESLKGFYSKDWWLLSNSNGSDGKQWQKVMQVRKKLREYNECLFLQVFLSKLDRPNKYDLEFLRGWLEHPKMGNFPLLGLDQHAWDEINKADLIVIRRREGSDPFSRWFTGIFIPVFHRVLGRWLKKTIPEAPDSGISRYSESNILVIIDAISTMISSLLPISAIVILYCVSNIIARLCIITGFTATFSLVLSLMTQSRRVEIFTAAAAFAAVQVVFVSGGYS